VFLWQKFPKFVPGFLLISVLATYHLFTKDQVGALANLSRCVSTHFCWRRPADQFSRDAQTGSPPFAVGAIGEVVIAGFTLGLVYGAGRLFGW
jgi:uncharacterized membrane protein YadS